MSIVPNTLEINSFNDDDLDSNLASDFNHLLVMKQRKTNISNNPNGITELLQIYSISPDELVSATRSTIESYLGEIYERVITEVSVKQSEETNGYELTIAINVTKNGKTAELSRVINSEDYV